MKVYVGCSGYFYWHWKGVFYPPDLPPHRWFAYYAGQFNTVEINATFYRFPNSRRVRSWVRQAPPGFLYALKAHRSLTHDRVLEDREGVRRFVDEVRVMGDLLGAILFQLPPRFHYTPDHLERVVRVLDPEGLRLPGGAGIAVEFRHASWWREEVWHRLEAAGLVGVTVVAPRLPRTYVQTGEEVYLRFHGVKRWYRDAFPEEDLNAYVRAVCQGKPRRVLAYFNNDVGGHAPRDALRFRARLTARMRGESPE